MPTPHRTDQLVGYEPWLRLLAQMEIDSRFQGKFSASDAVQETMLQAWRDWDKFRGEEEPQRRAWLRQILAHQLAHLARHYAGTQKRDVGREVSIDASLAQSSMRLERVLPPIKHRPAARQRRASNHCFWPGCLNSSRTITGKSSSCVIWKTCRTKKSLTA